MVRLGASADLLLNSAPQILQAAAFAADKHRLQRRKDAEATPYINHPLALARLLAHECAEQDPTLLLIAALLHDTVEDTDTTASPPADWSLERKREYFDWARQVVDQARGTHGRLERLFDAEYARRP